MSHAFASQRPSRTGSRNITWRGHAKDASHAADSQVQCACAFIQSANTGEKLGGSAEAEGRQGSRKAAGRLTSGMMRLLLLQQQKWQKTYRWNSRRVNVQGLCSKHAPKDLLPSIRRWRAESGDTHEPRGTQPTSLSGATDLLHLGPRQRLCDGIFEAAVVGRRVFLKKHGARIAVAVEAEQGAAGFEVAEDGIALHAGHGLRQHLEPAGLSAEQACRL